MSHMQTARCRPTAGGACPEAGPRGGFAGSNRSGNIELWPRLVDGEKAVAAFLKRFVTACRCGELDQSQRLDKHKTLLGFSTRWVALRTFRRNTSDAFT
jgi:hypothetical protein